MSKIVDERIVSMQFDNRQFESNVSDTMSTLDKLKAKLGFKGATQGLEEVSEASKRVDMTTLGNGIETVKAKFSALQIIGITALQNITNSAINSGKKIVSALTIDPIKTGLAEYETQLNAVQTILANTESKGSTLKDVNAALDELNTYADKTIYNFTEMTRNIGTFTAAGVDLDTATNAIQGIANLAAVSGSTSQQASTAMYQLSQALSSGTVKLMDWNSVVNAGMGGQVFQDALKETARVHGVAIDQIIKEQGSFRESLSEGWLTSEILTETLQKFTLTTEGLTEAQIEQNREMLRAKGYTDKQIEEIFKLGNTATNAATKVKTFSQLLDTLKESAQSGWSQTWKLIIGDFEEAKSLWTKVSDVIGGVINKSSEARNELIGGAFTSGWKQLLGEGIMDEEGYTHFVKETAKEHGVAIDEMIKQEGSFEKALQKGLQTGELSSDMLSEALDRLTKSREKMSDEQLKNLGFTKDQVKALSELNEQVQNGSISMDEFADKIKKLSGRELVMQSFANIWKSLTGILKPIKEAFRDIFPPTTSKQLYNILEGIKNLTSKFIISEETADKLKRTFRGLFAVIDIIVTVFKTAASVVGQIIGKFSGVTGGILSATASFGDFLVSIRDTIKESNGLVKIGGAIVNAIGGVINAVGKLGSAISNGIKTSGFEGLIGVIKKVWSIFSTIVGRIAKLIGDTFTGNGNIFETILGALSTGLLITITVKLKKAFESLGEVTGVFSNILESLTGPLQAFQDKLKAEALQKIGTAIALLAASLLVLSLIESDKLENAISAMVISLGVLMGALAVMGKISSEGIRNVVKLTGVVTSLLILSFALVILATLDWGEIARSLTVMTGALAVLIGAIAVMSKVGKAKNVLGLYTMSISLINVGLALKILGSMSWDDIGRALTVMAGALNILIFSLSTMSKIGRAKNIIGMYAMTLSLINLGAALKILATMSWDDIGRALVAMVGSLSILVITLAVMSKMTRAKNVVNLYAMTVSLINLSLALKILATMGWDDIGRALVAMLGSLTILVAALTIMSKVAGGVSMLASSAALLIMVAAINLLVPALALLGSMNIGTILKGLLAMAGAIGIFAGVAMLLSGAIPAMLGLAAATALLGAGLLMMGLGITALSAGLASLMGAVVGGASVIINTILTLLKGIIDLVPLILSAIAEGLVAFCQIIADGAPAIGAAVANLLVAAIEALVTVIPRLVSGILEILVGILKALATHIPVIVEVVVDLLVQVIKSISKFLPKLIVAAVELFSEFFAGVINALKGIDSKTLIEAILSVGLIAGIIAALAAISGMIPAAMLGVLGMGVVVAELAVVLAAIGALSRIPGLNNIIADGGKLLQTIGTAIGQFIGGLIGGIGRGVTGSLPAMGRDLSNFMENLKPFISGLNMIDDSTLNSAKSLAGTVLAITGANIVKNLTAWLSGGASMSSFGRELAAFGAGLKQYANEVEGIDEYAVAASADAAKALVDMSSHIPNQGGIVAWFTGDNSIAKFAGDLAKLGTGLKGYSDSISGFNSEAVVASANAAKALADMTAVIPNQGGMVAWFTGDNSIAAFALDLITLGRGLKGYSDAISGFNSETVIASASAAKALADMTTVIPNSGGIVAWFSGENSVAKFAGDLVTLGQGLTGFSNATLGINPVTVTAAATAAKALAEMTAAIPNEGGIKAWFAGEASVSKFAGDLVTLGQGLTGFSNATLGIVPESMIGAANAAKSLAEMTKFIPNEGGIKAWFTGEASVSKFAGDLISLGEGLAGFANATTGIVPESIVAAANAAKSLAEMTAVIPNEGGVKAWFTGEASVSKFAGDLPTLGQGLKGFSDSVTGIVPENVTAAAEAAKSLGEMTATIPTNTNKIIKFGENLVAFGKSLCTYFANSKNISASSIEALNKAIDAVKNLDDGLDAGSVKSAANAIKELTSALKGTSAIKDSTTNGFVSSLNKLGKTSIDKIVKTFEELKTKMEEIGEDAMTKLIEGMDNKQSAVIKACVNLVDVCADTISENALEFKTAGANLVKGFAAGISQNVYLAKAKAKAMAAAAAEAAKKELDEHSPSKVGYEIGDFFGVAFVNAISDYTSVAYDAGSSVAASAKKGLSSAVMKISDAINSDIDTQPTIKPVLDLSDIRDGAGAINSLFTSRTSLGVMARVNSISSSMNKNQNGSNYDVVSALKDLKETFINNPPVVNNINGVTYDDGSNITDAVAAIVRAARIERRR